MKCSARPPMSGEERRGAVFQNAPRQTPMSQYWSITPDWQGEAVAILGGGPSMEGLDVSALAGCRVIAINDAFRIYPTADLLYFCDRRWWDGQHGREVAVRAAHIGMIATLESDILGVLRLRNTGERGYDGSRDALRTGRNSGYQAMQVAMKLGVRRIVLFGFDFRVTGGRTHWGSRPERQQPADFARALAGEMLPCFADLVPVAQSLGVEVVNASPGSRLTLWPAVSHVEGTALLRGG